MIFGFIGVGLMGGPLARNLIRAGKTVHVYNRSPEAIQRTLDSGATGLAATSMADMAPCQVVFSCLAMPQHVKDKMLGAEGAYAHMREGSIHVECSTLDPATAHELAQEAAQHHIAYVQCTLGKTPAQAETAQQPMFIGGSPEAIETLKDIFPLIGIPSLVGSIDAACAVKLISNLVGMTNLAVLAEGLRLGQAAGISPQTLLPLLTDTGARSFQMDVRGPWMATEDYSPRFALDIALKDVRLGCEMAEAWGLEPALMQATLNYLRQSSAQGLGAEDCCAMYKNMTQKGKG